MDSKPLSVYSKYLEIRTEILKHKWIESEKANQDIGFENALIDWVAKHRLDWVKEKSDQIDWQPTVRGVGCIHNEGCTSNRNRSDNLLVHRLDDLSVLWTEHQVWRQHSWWSLKLYRVRSSVVEQRPFKPLVVGSSPTGRTNLNWKSCSEWHSGRSVPKVVDMGKSAS